MKLLPAKHQDLPNNWTDREALREKGQFWTPEWVAKAMVAYVAKDADLILDPSAGEGVFCRILNDSYPKMNYLGFDIDAHIIKGIPNLKSNTVEIKDFIKTPPTIKFKGIVCNPPYIRHHRVDEQTKNLLKSISAKVMGFTLDGRTGYHVFFLIQALSLLDKGGKLAFILPADTCEGVFAKKLWDWIGKNYCIECVVTFDHEATPFPNVDTNAVVFFIKNKSPRIDFLWARVNEPTLGLHYLVNSNFEELNIQGIEIINRDLGEALDTGLSRKPHSIAKSIHTLSDFATVMRGIATGATEFFFLTEEQIKENGLAKEFFIRCIGRTRDVQGDTLTLGDLEELEKKGRPTWLMSINQPYDSLPKNMKNYLQKGLDMGLAERALIKPRNPWYKTEKRIVPEMLFAYLGRRNTRFIKNEAKVVPLHCLHCIYTKSKDVVQVDKMWKTFNHPDTLANLGYVSKSYGSGALKAEPQNLKNLLIPEALVSKNDLIISKLETEVNPQLSLFNN